MAGMSMTSRQVVRRNRTIPERGATYYFGSSVQPGRAGARAPWLRSTEFLRPDASPPQDQDRARRQPRRNRHPRDARRQRARHEDRRGLPRRTSSRCTASRRTRPTGSAKGMGPVEAYLSIPEIIRVAPNAAPMRSIRATGLLSENPEFVDACAEAGIIFIGPTPETMRASATRCARATWRWRPACRSSRRPSRCRRRLPKCSSWPRQVGYPGDAQGHLGRRRARHARHRRRATNCSSRGADGTARGEGRLRQGRGLSRKADRARPPRRGADPRRHARQPRAPVRARLLGAAPQPEGRRARAGALSWTTRSGSELCELGLRIGRARRTTSAPARSSS